MNAIITEKIERMMERDNTHPQDKEREALFVIICGNQELYEIRERIYNFKEHCIEPDILETGICTSSKRMIEIGFNLFNNFQSNTTNILNSFSGLDFNNYKLAMQAIDIRMGYNINR